MDRETQGLQLHDGPGHQSECEATTSQEAAQHVEMNSLVHRVPQDSRRNMKRPTCHNKSMTMRIEVTVLDLCKKCQSIQETRIHRHATRALQKGHTITSLRKVDALDLCMLQDHVQHLKIRLPPPDRSIRAPRRLFPMNQERCL